MGISISGLKVGHKEFKDGYEQFANGPDSVGGIGVQFSFRNEGEKTIKYVTISFIPYTINEQIPKGNQKDRDISSLWW